MEVGLRVRMNPEHPNYQGYMYQHKGDEGAVTRVSGISCHVRWANGHENSYFNNSLIIIDEAYLKKVEEENKMYELPYLPGTRVCLNPESDRFSSFLTATGGTAGNVLYMDFDDSKLHTWSKVERKGQIYVNVLFDNGWEGMCKHKDLLPVDTKPQTITEIRFRNGNIKYVRDNNEETLKEIDKIVITQGQTISEKNIYDNEWRASMVQEIMSASADTSAPQKAKAKKAVPTFAQFFDEVATMATTTATITPTTAETTVEAVDEDWEA